MGDVAGLSHSFLFGALASIYNGQGLLVTLLRVSLDTEGVLYVFNTLYTGESIVVQFVFNVCGLNNLLLEARVLSLLSLVGFVDHVL